MLKILSRETSDGGQKLVEKMVVESDARTAVYSLQQSNTDGVMIARYDIMFCPLYVGNYGGLILPNLKINALKKNIWKYNWKVNV